MPLGQLAQRDFPAGEFRGVAPFLIPEIGVAVARNCLLDEDGAIYKRGGTGFLTDTQLGVQAQGLTMIWDGYLVPGRVTVVADSDHLHALDATDALLGNNLGLGVDRPSRAVEHRGILFGDGGQFMWGGAGTGSYSTGTIAVTAGSKTVTGTGTTWTTCIVPGALLRVGGSGPRYVVESVQSNTSLTLHDTFNGATATGLAYLASFSPIAVADPYKAGYYAVAADKLLVGSGRFLYMSKPGRPGEFDPTDYHELPDGVRITGVEAIGDRALIFTTQGLWVLSNLSYDLTDDFGNPQQRLDKASDDLILWSREGVASWGNALVVPCTDGVWLVDGISKPQRLTNSISKLYQSYVEQGFRTGVAAVFRSHYFLPILDAGDNGIELRVCRLDRPTNVGGLGTVYPWTFFDGHGGDVRAMTVRVADSPSRQPKLLATSGDLPGRILTLNSCFEPSATYKRDGSGSVPQWELVTRDYTTGELNENTVRRLRVRYEMADAAADDPKITAGYHTEDVGGEVGTNWDEFNWDEAPWGGGQDTYIPLSGDAPEDNGGTPFTWHFAKKGRYIRFRLFSTSPVARLIFRSIELFIRPSRRP